MDIEDAEESLFAISDAKLHGGMCEILYSMYCKVMNIFPAIEAARPRSRSGIQALCSLHVSLEKAKNLLQHCSECGKLYLAVTGDSIVLKFERTKCALVDSLRRLEDIVPQSIGCQIQCVVSELEGTVFALDPAEKQIGDDIIALLQQGRKFDDNSNDNTEIESFHQAASKLGITSSQAALTERRALKKLIEKAHLEDDKRKESIVAYLLHLMRKYSKLFRSDLGDDNDSQGSTPCSPTLQGSLEDGGGPTTSGRTFDKQISKISSFNFKPSLNFKPNGRRSEQMTVPPEELRCPISLQLMHDPVIIASGQTYERICIEKWFSDGHRTCPKTQQQLVHLSLTPNYCVKGLIASWCEQNGVPVPDGPPESLDLNYWRLVLSDTESPKSRSVDSAESGKSKGVKVAPIEESDVREDVDGNEAETDAVQEEENEMHENFLSVLEGGDDLRTKCRIVEKIRRLLKDDEEARTFMGAHGFVEALVRFLQSAMQERNEVALEVGAMALFNLAVNNNRNKELMLAAGIIPLLDEMMMNPDYHGLAAALYLNLSCLEETKPVIGSGEAVPFLVKLLQVKSDPQGQIDALHALFNLSTCPSNIQYLLEAEVVNTIQSFLTDPSDHTWTEKSIAVLTNLASDSTAKEAMISAPGLISAFAEILDTGTPIEQEQAVSCLLILCNGNEKCSQIVLQEGVIPSLVSVQVNGTPRGRDKAQKLLMLFREQRQRDSSPQQVLRSPSVHVVSKSNPEPNPNPKQICQLSKSASERAVPDSNPKSLGKMQTLGKAMPLGKSISRRTLGKTFSYFRKSKHFSGP